MELIKTDTTVCKIILKDGSYYDVDESLMMVLQVSYPAIDVQGELMKMVAWHLMNDAKRKTRKGIKRSINSWLNAAKPKPVNTTQKDHRAATSISERVNDLSWADGL